LFLAFGAETNELGIVQRITMTTLLAYQTIPDRSHDLESVTLDTVWAAHRLYGLHKGCGIVSSALIAKRFMCHLPLGRIVSTKRGRYVKSTNAERSLHI
jgi:hypothetical protein